MYCSYSYVVKKQKVNSVTGNRTPVSRVTGGDTYHYTITELLEWTHLFLSFLSVRAAHGFLRQVTRLHGELKAELING